MKLGLWENGKRIMWFNEDDARRINNGTLLYGQFFVTADSHEHVSPDATLSQPLTFSLRLNEVKKSIARIKAETN